jgi:hypothetical protein
VKLERVIEEVAGEATGGGGTGSGLAGIQQAVAMLAVVEGKKAIVYLSAGRTFGEKGDPEVQRTIDAAVKAGVAFYQVDARGR